VSAVNGDEERNYSLYIALIMTRGGGVVEEENNGGTFLPARIVSTKEHACQIARQRSPRTYLLLHRQRRTLRQRTASHLLAQPPITRLPAIIAQLPAASRPAAAMSSACRR